MKTLQADWLQGPELKAIIAALGVDNIRFVGGVVRDTILGGPVSDIDAATPHPPEQTIKLLHDAGLKAIPTGLQHGTVTALCGAETVEVTTLRIDKETDGRHARVSYTRNWLEDAKRRDFTFNAMYLTPDGELYDPFDGLRDLTEGKIRFIGDAGKRIEEDGLRILRFFRFFAKYGKGSPDKVAFEACRKNKDMLQRVSIERIRDEFMKLLAVPEPEQALEGLVDSGILEAALGQGAKASNCLKYIEAEKVMAVTQNPNVLARFFFLVSPSCSLSDMPSRFRLSRDQGKRLARMGKACAVLPFTNTAQARRVCYLLGKEAVLTALLFEQGAAVDVENYQSIADWPVPVFPIRGKDLIVRGVAPGSAMGNVLKRLEQEWVDSDFQIPVSELYRSLGH